MSNLNPGGSRSRGARVFGAENIRRAVQRNVHNRDLTADAHTSIATKPHDHSREVARRLRQQQRRMSK